MHTAAGYGRHEMLDDLLNYYEYNPDSYLEQNHYIGVTALHWAVKHNRPESVRILLEAGADRELQGCWHQGLSGTPLDFAVAKNKPEIVRILNGEEEREEREARAREAEAAAEARAAETKPILEMLRGLNVGPNNAGQGQGGSAADLQAAEDGEDDGEESEEEEESEGDEEEEEESEEEESEEEEEEDYTDETSGSEDEEDGQHSPVARVGLVHVVPRGEG